MEKTKGGLAAFLKTAPIGELKSSPLHPFFKSALKGLFRGPFWYLDDDGNWHFHKVLKKKKVLHV